MGATVLAQTPATDQSAPPAATQPAASQSATSATNPNDSSTYATGKPLEGQSNEGFWGHMNPFARKKWVKRAIDPIRDRENELDQLQAKNANDIKDVDQRAQAGINNAMMAANTADQHAADASNRANAAQTTANTATSKTDALNGTVSNLDQYQQVSSTDVKFARGRTTLGPEGRSTLDDMATKLANEKGYILEIQAFSPAGVQSSQAMADSVARYLVTEHQVPLYRIYRTGLGRAPKAGEATATAAPSTSAAASTEAAGGTMVAENEMPITDGVRVTLLHNSLASMGGTESGSNAATPSYNGAAPSTNGAAPSVESMPNDNGQPAPQTNQ